MDCFKPIDGEKYGDHAGEPDLLLGLLNGILNGHMAIGAFKIILGAYRVPSGPDYTEHGD